MANRPTKIMQYPREDRKRSNTLKGHFHRFLKGNPGVSLKAFAKLAGSDPDESVQLAAMTWLNNKAAKTAKPSKGWGSTRRKSKKQ